MEHRPNEFASRMNWTSCLLFMLLLLGVLSRNVIDLPLGKWLVLAVPSILESAAALEMNNAEKKMGCPIDRWTTATTTTLT